MKELFTPLSDDEYERLDEFLLERIDDDADTRDKDEGVLDISELDGLFTAIVSGPVTIMPSQWLPAVWGDFEPVWQNEEEFREILSLMMRHMNAIANMLMETPEAFEPVYFEREVEGDTCTIVDEWCEGYWRGVQLSWEDWDMAGKEMAALLAPILAFTGETNWRGHDFAHDEVETIQQAIVSNVRAIHTYWLARRAEHEPVARPVRRSELRVGRNDPCPCGSGKKYKKCCLH
jgi:uncharacterized protein